MKPDGCMLVAAGLDWLEGLLPFLFVLIWIVSQVMNLFRGAAKNPGNPPVAPPRRPPRPQPGGDVAELEREIDEFLQRSLERPATPPRLPQPVKPAKPRRKAPPPTAPATLRPPVGAAAGGDVAGHVAVAFAHDLVHASPDRTSAPAGRVPQASPQSELLAALRAPDGLKQLILMREVLERPTYRW